MTEKPTYGELKQRRGELEKETLESKQTVKTVRRLVEELTAMNALARKVTSSLSVNQVVLFTHEEILSAAAPDLVVVYLVKGDRLIFQGVKPEKLKFRDVGTQVKRVGQCLCGLVAKEGKPVYSIDIHADARCTLDACKKAGIHSFAALPLAIGDNILGVLGIASCTERDFSQQADFLQGLASHVTFGLQNARLHEEVQRYAAQLERHVTELKRAEDALRDSEKKYSTLVENSLTGIYIDQDGKIAFANNRFGEIYGYSRDELIGMETWKLIHPGDRALTNEIRKKRLKGEKAPLEYEARGLTRNAETIWILRRNTRIEYKGRPAILGNIAEITKRKHAEEALQKKRNALKVQARNLEEVNTALKVLLKQREKDRTELEEKILSNVKELVLPYVEALKMSQLDSTQMAYTSIVEERLNDIISPFLRNLSSKFLDLTPKEIQVASLIKDGKTTKEIAELLYVSTRSIEFHRENIRSKLGLKKKRANLRSYLSSLT